ncbi:MAG TPA: hypothetical protein VIJ16_05625 [Gemmatimonadaceae bacterium]
MTWREWTERMDMRVALGVAAVSLALCVGALIGALRQPGPPEIAPTVTVSQGALAVPDTPPPVDVVAAVATDLFSTDRTAPASRYRMPDDVAVPVQGPADVPKPEVLGTAIDADGTSFATCRLASARLLMVRVGDHVGNYIVKSIERGRVVFTTPAGTRLEILAPRSGS